MHKAIDGGTVTIDGPVDLRAPFTSSGRLLDGAIVRELTTAPPGTADAFSAEATFAGAAVEEYDIQGGRLRVLARAHRDPRTGSVRIQVAGIWEGAHHALVLHDTDVDATAVIDRLTGLDLEDDEAGLRVVADGGRPWYDPARLVKELPGLGLAEIQPLTRTAERELPPFAGTETDGGELYRDETIQGTPTLLLVNDTAVTRLTLDEAASPDDAATSASGLVVTWEAA